MPLSTYFRFCIHGSKPHLGGGWQVGNGTCAPSGLCYEPSWCNVDAKPETYEIESSDLDVMVCFARTLRKE
eukprot:2336410-Amphidinium_carterae.3